MYNSSDMKSMRSLNSKRSFGLMPRFTVVHHPIREKFDLTMAAYALIDSIDQLSHRPDHPWCETKKEALGQFIGIVRSTVYKAIDDGLEKGLIEKNERGDLRTTQLWVEQVRLYDAKER